MLLTVLNLQNMKIKEKIRICMSDARMRARAQGSQKLQKLNIGPKAQWALKAQYFHLCIGIIITVNKNEKK